MIRKRFGQHFLEPAWTTKVISAIAPAASDCFVEIGPGKGALTCALAANVTDVLAIEIDRKLAAALMKKEERRFSVIVGNVLKADLVQLASKVRQHHPKSSVRLVGNLPYNISSPVLFQIFRAHRAAAPFLDATLMVQREVGDRLVAQCGTKAYGPLAILSAAQAEVRRLLVLPPGAFRPTPKVNSALISFKFRRPSIDLRHFDAFEKLVRGIFQHRRKMLRNALRSVAAGSDPPVEPMLEAAGLDGRRRPEPLRFLELTRLSAALNASSTRTVI